MKKYKLEYDTWYNIEFTVDDEIFTEDYAQLFLDFWSSDYDDYDDLIVLALKKIAVKCFYLSNDFIDHTGIISEIKNHEGFFALDGSVGVTLTRCDSIELDEDRIELIE